MRLSQEAIQRMISGRSGGGAGGGGSFDPSALAGYATQAWTEENYISKTFFNELFVIHKKVTTVVMDGETEISRTVTTNSIFAPNEIPGITTETDEETGYVTTVTTEIASIESKKGFWTNYFLSALGLNSEGGGGGLTLNEPLATINVSGLAAHPSSSGQTIVWNGSAWVYGTAGGGTGTVTGVKVGDITYSPVNGIVSIPAYPTSLAWSAITSKPTTIAGYGITDAKIENGVITLGSNTITPLTSSDISDMATKTWVGNNYLPLTGGTLSISSIGGFTIKNTTSNYPLIRFEGNTGGGLGFIGFGKTGSVIAPYYVTADANGGYTDGVSQWHFLLHSGNYTDYTYSKSYIDTELAKKLDVAFFDALFQAYAGGTKVTPNASTSSVDNIKAMFGFWTQQYISALGKNDSQGVVSALSDLSDVTITSPSDGQALIYDGGIWKNGAAGMNMSELTTYLSSKILTVKNGTATLGTWNPTAAGTIDIASAVSGYVTALGTNGDYMTWTKNGTANNLTVPYATHATRLAQSDLANDGDLSQFTHATDLIYAAKGGGNTVTDKPTGVDSFGVLSLKTAVGYYGQILLDAGGALYMRSSNSLSGVAWKKMLDSANTYVTNGKGYINGTEITAISGNAETASRLADNTAKTAWGRTYWSGGVPQNVSGNIDVNTGEFLRLKDGTDYYRIIGISSDSTLLIGWDMRSQNRNTTISSGKILNIGYGTNASDTSYGKYWTVFLDNGHVTINSNDDTEVTRNIFLNIGGNTKTNRLYLHTDPNGDTTNDVYLVYENGGVHVVGGGLYADTYVSALGLSDSGGSAFDETAMWIALGTTIAEKQISSTYLTNALAPYAMKTDIPSLNSLSWSYGSVISASGGSYNGSAVTSFVIPKNTSHLTNDSGFITSSALGAYLPLTGGTLSLPGIGNLTIKNTASNYPLIRFEGNTGGGLGFIGIGKTGNVIEPFYVTADANGGYTDGVSQWNRIWHSGNDSALLSSFVNSGDNVSLTVGSTTKTLTVGYSTRALRLKNIVMAAGDDYDTLSGYTADRGSFVAANINSVPSSSITLDGMDNNWATLLSFGYANRTIQFIGFGWSDTLKYRHVYTISGTNYGLSPWKTIAFTDSNVASATRLAGTSTNSVWGRTYWSNGQPQDVSGNIEYTGNITPSSNNVSNIGTSSNYYSNIYSGHLNVIDSSSNENYNVEWRTVDNKRVLAMYCYASVWSDMILGSYSSTYGLYYNATTGSWGIGTSVPGQRFSSENVGLKLDVAGIARANQLQAYNSAGETMLLNSTTSYDCIVFQINGASKWSVGADSGNNFYWYTQPGGSRTVMSLTSAGVLNVSNSVKCTDLWIGNIHITYDSTNGGIHVANGGLSANTYVSALGVGQEGGGTQGLDIEAMWTELGTPNSARQIDKTHISNALSDYVTTDTLNGYATQQWVNSQGFAYASSLSNYVSSVSMSSGQLNVTKGGSTTSTDIVALRLGQTTLGDSASLATFTHSTDLIYTSKGGSNTCSDKPTGVDSFGLIAMKTAVGYYGQILMTPLGEVYTRASNSLSGGWRKQLDSSNWSSTVTLSALGGASTVALSEATTRISTLEGYFNTGGVAKKAAVLNTARTINGTNFDGSASITTRSWGTARTITIADYDSTNTHANNGIDGSENITLYLPSTIKATLDGNASSANIATTASKLSTVSKTAWGQTYWTSGGVPTDVNGSIEAGNSGGYIGGFDHIDLNTHASLLGYGGYIDFYYEGANSYTSRIIEKESGVLSINAPNVAGLLVGGYNGDYLQIGQIRIVYEYDNNALRIENANNGGAANLYALGGISALGMSGNADGTINGNLIPSANATYSIGSSSYGWKELRLSQYGVSGRITIDGDGINIVSNEGGYLSGALYMVTGRMIVGASDDDYAGFTFATEGTSYLSSKVSIGGTNSNSDKLYVNGTVRASSYNNSSDARLKNIISNENIDIETIARAPIVRFTWKNTDDSRVHWGTLAQYWRSTEIGDIVEDGEYLAMDYAATALAGVISVARKVMTHEEEIAALKRRIGELENEIETLKAA